MSLSIRSLHARNASREREFFIGEEPAKAGFFRWGELRREFLRKTGTHLNH